MVAVACSPLLSPLAGKESWTIADAAGDSTPGGMQRLLNNFQRNADAVRDDLRDYVGEHLGEPDGVLIVDETGFLKKGVKSPACNRSTRRPDLPAHSAVSSRVRPRRRT
jgi:SRSO17 transposase